MGYQERSDDVRRAALSGLQDAALSFQKSLQVFREGEPGTAASARQLSDTSLAAGRLIGYVEALEAMGATRVRAVGQEVIEVMDEVQAILCRFLGSWT